MHRRTGNETIFLERVVCGSREETHFDKDQLSPGVMVLSSHCRDASLKGNNCVL